MVADVERASNQGLAALLVSTTRFALASCECTAPPQHTTERVPSLAPRAVRSNVEGYAAAWSGDCFKTGVVARTAAEAKFSLDDLLGERPRSIRETVKSPWSVSGVGHNRRG